MKKYRKLTIGGIQSKIFNLMLVTMILFMVVNGAVILYQGTRLQKLISDTSEAQQQGMETTVNEIMDTVVSATLTSNTRMQATISDDMFRDLEAQVEMLGEYAQHILENPDGYPGREVFLPDASLEGEVTIQLLAEEEADPEDPQVLKQLGLIANLSEMMISLYKTGQINSCYVALPSGVMLLADDHSASKYTSDGTLIPIPIHERDWYQGAVETGSLYFTDVQQDVFTGQVGIMCSQPVYQDGELAAVIGADLYLDSMEQSVAASAENSGFLCIINNQGHVIFSPEEEGTFQVIPGQEAQDLRAAENAVLADCISRAMAAETDAVLVDVDGKEYYISGAPIETVGWAVLSLVDASAVRQPAQMISDQYEETLVSARDTFEKGLQSAKWMILVLLVILLAMGITGALIVSKRIVKPLETMTRKVGALGGDNLQFRMEKAFQTGDEIEVLAESFADLSARTLRYVDQVQKVTAEKERIGTELNMATQIQASQLPRLFPAFPNRPEFDVYASMTPAREVGGDFYDFFLVDHDHIGLVMADVSGKGVPAALFMMISRVLIKSRIQNGESPAEALIHVNEQLCEGNDAGYFVTVWLGVLEISTGKGVAANAGHEHPAIRRKDGKYELEVYRHSPAVGMMEGMQFKEHDFHLRPGDSLFVYTDGVAEATDARQELFGTDRMLDALNQEPDASPEQILGNVMRSIHEFVGEAEQFDDITMLCLKYNGPQNDDPPIVAGS